MGTKPDGKEGIVLESLPDNAPVKPKDEAEVAATAKVSKKARVEPVPVAVVPIEELKPRRRTPKKGD